MNTQEMVAVLAVMTFVTFLTRAGGVALMSVVPMSPKVRQFLRALSGSVLVALIAPAMLAGDWPMRIGAGVCLLAMMLHRSQLVALGVGILSVALLRSLYV